MIKRYIGLLLFILCVLMPCLANAEELKNDTFGVTVTLPEGWTEHTGTKDAKTVFVIGDPTTENRIELLATKVLRPEHAVALFEAFAEQMETNGFTVAVPEKETTFGSYTGKLTEYDYLTSDVPLRVMNFILIQGELAYIAVAYATRAERDDVSKQLEKFVASLQIAK